ncbi:tmem9 domain, member B [Chamberlinius hualienensis]
MGKTTFELKISLTLFVFIAFLSSFSQALFEDKRCKCVCPDTMVVNTTKTDRRFYIGNVPANNCTCERVVMPMVDPRVKEQEFCPRCTCRYESRNTTTIRVVVIIVIWIISLLVIYMLFLMCLDPLLNKRATHYQEHTDEDVSEIEQSMPQYAGVSGVGVGGGVGSGVGGSNVLNRVGHQQFKWKKQVQEQRRNIYDRHAMLN